MSQDETHALIAVAPEGYPSVVALTEEAMKLEEYALERVIESTTDVRSATEDLSIMAALKKSIAAKQKEFVGPLTEHLNHVKSVFKSVLAPVEEADRMTRSKILDYRKEEQRRADEAEAIRQQERELLERKAALSGEPAPEPERVVQQAPVPTTSHGELGRTDQKDNWKWEEVDHALVPREYMKIDPGVMTPMVKASKGKVTIPGIRIYNEPILAVTSNIPERKD